MWFLREFWFLGSQLFSFFVYKFGGLLFIGLELFSSLLFVRTAIS